MEKNRIFGLLTAGLALAFTACNNSSDNSAASDSTNKNTTVTNTSTNNYAARADTVNTNVSKGYYLNPKTGRPYTHINVDTNTGAVTDEGGQPIRRYVDSRNWWVYDTRIWDTVGSAQMNNGNLMYRDANGNWITYDKRWSDDMMNDTSGNMNNASSNDTATMNGKMKVKTSTGKTKVTDKGVKNKPKNQ